MEEAIRLVKEGEWKDAFKLLQERMLDVVKAEDAFVVIEDDIDVVQALRRDGIPALYGNAAAPGMLELAQVEHARWLLLAIPDPLESGQVIAEGPYEVVSKNPQVLEAYMGSTDNQLEGAHG